MRGCGFRVMILLIIATGILIYRGSAGLYESSKFTKPVDITIDQLTQQKPGAGWFNVTDGFMAVIYGVYTKVGEAEPTKIGELFVPLLSENQLKDAIKAKHLGSIDALVVTSDPKVLSTFEVLRSNPNDDKTVEKMNPEELFTARSVEGMVATSIHSLSDNDAKAVRGAMPQLAPDCIILREGHKPDKGSSVGTLLGGIFLGVVTVVFCLYRYSKYRSLF